MIIFVQTEYGGGVICMLYVLYNWVSEKHLCWNLASNNEICNDFHVKFWLKMNEKN